MLKINKKQEAKNKATGGLCLKIVIFD